MGIDRTGVDKGQYQHRSGGVVRKRSEAGKEVAERRSMAGRSSSPHGVTVSALELRQGVTDAIAGIKPGPLLCW